jgi:hypothetical protein
LPWRPSACLTASIRIIIFLEQRREVLNELFGVALRRAPSVNTLRTVLQDLDGDTLERAFRQHAAGLLVRREGGMSAIALDGKTLKGSVDHLNDRKAAQALSAGLGQFPRSAGVVELT